MPQNSFNSFPINSSALGITLGMKRSGFAFIESFVPVLLLAMLSALLVPNFLRARAQGQLTACRSNLKNIASALEMYGQDSRGAYPAQLATLTSTNYLKVIPTCPAATVDTYSASFTSAGSNYTLSCQGAVHQKVGLEPDFPQYLSSTGPTDGRLGPQASGLNALFEGLLSVAMIPVWGFFLYRLIERPQPMTEVKELEAQHGPLAVLAWLGWLSLNGVFTAAFWLGTQPLWHGMLSPLLAPLLGCVTAEWTVRAGWWVWGKLSPAVPTIDPAPSPAKSPALGASLRTRLTPPPLAPLLQFGVPLTLLAVLTLAPLVGPHPDRDPYLGLALAALLSFPAYLWARNWARELFEREVELLPGSGILLEHSRRWGRTRVTRLATLADVVPCADGFRVQGRHYRLRDSEFLKELQ